MGAWRLFAFAALCLVGVIPAAQAHMDTWLSLTPDGAVAQLPDRYQSTRIHLKFARDATARLQRLVFVAGGHETVIADCWLRLVPDGARESMKISGSWYHDLKRLPPYVQLRFDAPRQGRDPDTAPGFRSLFNLQNGQLMSVTEAVAAANEPDVTMNELDLKQTCPAGSSPPVSSSTIAELHPSPTRRPTL